MALGRNPVGWAVFDPTTEWSMNCNTPLWPLLGLIWGRIGPIRSIGWYRHALAFGCFFSPECTVQSVFAEQFPTHLFSSIRRGLRANGVESKLVLTTVELYGIKTRNWLNTAHTYIYIYVYIYIKNLALNNPQRLICHKTQTTNNQPTNHTLSRKYAICTNSFYASFKSHHIEYCT